MKHSFFEIKNFKGIDHITFVFDGKPNSRVYTLVGLNESGKTTILEAMDFFAPSATAFRQSRLQGRSISDPHQLIPISKRSNFNGEISIKVGYLLDDSDLGKIAQFAEDRCGFIITRPISRELTITNTYKFSRSNLEDGQPKYTWNFTAYGKTKRGKTEKKLDGENWNQITNFIETLIPKVLYFPNFLFEFPERIYLENAPSDVEKHKFYREILEDVLRATDSEGNLEELVIARMKGKVDWKVWDSQTLESVLLNMGSHVTNTIFTQWNKIFKNQSKGKEITIEPGRQPSLDEDKGDMLFLQLKLKDGNQKYSITDRSLGFRWFFTFLLFTQYPGFRGDESQNNRLFLFDEPASNLHSSAQTQLLESFGKFPDNSSIVYTTHSHYLINAAWLESSFVVRNEGLDLDAETDDFNASKTVISLNKYRDFASANPSLTTYFQPILDVLDYCPSQLENVPNVVILEGKNDFYTIKYLSDRIATRKNVTNLMPGGGASSLDAVIQLYIAWGREFIILLDSDNGGKSQKKRYEDKFGILMENRVFVLSDIDKKWDKSTMEGLFTEAERLKIQRCSYPETEKFNKTHFNRAIQEALLTRREISLSVGTVSKFTKVLDFCSDRLKK